MKTLFEIEKDYIIKILKSTKYNISKTSEILGITMKTLYFKCHIYDIETRKN